MIISDDFITHKQMDNILSKPFDLSELTVSFKDDPKYIHLDTTLRIVVTTLIKQLEVCNKLVNNQTYDRDLVDITASNIYNNLYSSHPFSSNTNFSDEIMDNDLLNFCTVFKNMMDEDTSLGLSSKQIQDPRLCMFNFVHYMFIPVRVDIASLSDDVKINSLRKWITVISTLPFIEQYLQKYINAVTNMDTMIGIVSKILSSEDIRSKLIGMDSKFIFKSIAPRDTTKNTSQVFLRLLGNLVILISIEVMKKWCPNIRECMSANPDYDGSWLNPFDTMVNDQVNEIQKISHQLCETVKE